MWLLLKSNISRDFKFNKNYTYLLELKKINIIVGKNNSGKSYLMREILKNSISIISRDEIKKYIFENSDLNDFDKLQSFKNIEEFKKLNDKYLNILIEVDNFNNSKKESGKERIGGNYSGKIYTFENFEILKSKSKELLEYLGIDINTNYEFFSDEVVHNVSNLKENIISKYKSLLIEEYDNLNDESIYQFGNILYEFGYVKNKEKEYIAIYNQSNKEVIPYSFKNYIPLLRNIRHPLKNPQEKLDKPLDDVFKIRIISEYNYNKNEINIITGLDFYFEYKKKLLGSKHDRSLVNDFEKFLSNYFFEGKDISIIPDEETYELKVNIEDSEDRFIYQVGDGVTSLIIIMYNIFLNSDRKNNIYFIEEPEQSFHPGFQRLFMNMVSLNDKFKNCYFFFTTHSNHLIDISNHEFKNFNNYLCSKNKDLINVKVQNEEDAEIIDELGVNPSSVQIANKIIWVEGKYDAFYIRLLLNKKNINDEGRKYIEEYDYVFVPYGGSNGTLINFSIENSPEENKEFILKAKKINKNMLIVMDDDGISKGNCGSAKKERYCALKGELNDNLYKLEVREIENLFPADVVKQFFKDGLKNNKRNLSFLDNIKYEDYKNEKLGNYLNKLIKENLGDDLKKITGRKNGFESKGFLYDKSKFYDCVLNWIMSETFDYERDVPNETKNLINIVEKFIKK